MTLGRDNFADKGCSECFYPMTDDRSHSMFVKKLTLLISSLE